MTAREVLSLRDLGYIIHASNEFDLGLLALMVKVRSGEGSKADVVRRTVVKVFDFRRYWLTGSTKW